MMWFWPFLCGLLWGIGLGVSLACFIAQAEYDPTIND
jgi:hypothetical protein